jgi:hypothetical protein
MKHVSSLFPEVISYILDGKVILFRFNAPSFFQTLKLFLLFDTHNISERIRADEMQNLKLDLDVVQWNRGELSG